jgi:DNA-directed RNA polymerase specialized sigma24 family protein
VPLHGDEADLYHSNHAALQRDVAATLPHASRDTIEDACAFAWLQFLERQPDRTRDWRRWLYVVAVHEASHLDRRCAKRREHETQLRAAGSLALAAERDPLALRDAWLDARRELARIPPRARQAVVLQALGHRRAEIAELLGSRTQRVDRLLTRARAHLDALLSDSARAGRSSSPRATRLRALEDQPPPWLLELLGPLPRAHRGAALQTRRRAWRRAALALDDLLATTDAAEGGGASAASAAVRQHAAREAAQRALAAYQRIPGAPDRA